METLKNMPTQFFRKLTVVAIAFIFTLILGIAPAFATTLSFKAVGNAKRDGVLTGQLVFEDAALQKAIRETSTQQMGTQPIPISKIEGAKFQLQYISPYSGAEHTEATLCGKEIYDINGFEETPLAGGNEPTLMLSAGGQPEFIDFSSCVGQAGSVSSKVSDRDSRIASSMADALFGKLSVSDKDVMGNVVYKKIQPIKFTLKP